MNKQRGVKGKKQEVMFLGFDGNSKFVTHSFLYCAEISQNDPVPLNRVSKRSAVKTIQGLMREDNQEEIDMVALQNKRKARTKNKNARAARSMQRRCS